MAEHPWLSGYVLLQAIIDEVTYSGDGRVLQCRKRATSSPEGLMLLGSEQR